MVCHKPWHLQCLKPNIPLRPCVAHDMKSIFIQIFFHGCLYIEMTHNVKLISERTDIGFSISYLPEKQIFSFILLLIVKWIYNILERTRWNIFIWFIVLYLSLCIMIQGITLMSSKLCWVVIAYYNKHFCARSSGM